jgi:hypothetical protein
VQVPPSTVSASPGRALVYLSEATATSTSRAPFVAGSSHRGIGWPTPSDTTDTPARRCGCRVDAFLTSRRTDSSSELAGRSACSDSGCASSPRRVRPRSPWSTGRSPVTAREGYPLRYSNRKMLWVNSTRPALRILPVVVTVRKGIALTARNAAHIIVRERRLEVASRHARERKVLAFASAECPCIGDDACSSGAKQRRDIAPVDASPCPPPLGEMVRRYQIRNRPAMTPNAGIRTLAPTPEWLPSRNPQA